MLRAGLVVQLVSHKVDNNFFAEDLSLEDKLASPIDWPSIDGLLVLRVNKGKPLSIKRLIKVGNRFACSTVHVDCCLSRTTDRSTSRDGSSLVTTNCLSRLLRTSDSSKALYSLQELLKTNSSRPNNYENLNEDSSLTHYQKCFRGYLNQGCCFLLLSKILSLDCYFSLNSLSTSLCNCT